MPEIYLDLKANLQKQTIFHPLLNLVIACSEKEKLNQQQQDHARAGHICEDNYLRVHARLRKKTNLFFSEMILPTIKLPAMGIRR